MEELASSSFVSEFHLICVDPSPSRPPLPSWLKSVPALVVLGEDTPRVGPGSVNNWLFERKQGASGGARSSAKSASESLEERRAPLAPPVYNPDMAPRPDATSRVPAAARGGGSGSGSGSGGGSSSGSLPPAISGSTAANSSMAPPALAGNDGGPMAYHDSEMSGGKWSDDYSFLGGVEFTSDKGFNPISRNFESLVPVGGGSGGAGGGAGGGASAAQTSKRSAKEDALLREFETFSASRDRDIQGPVARR